MQNWFEVRTKYVKIDENGSERKASELYLIDAMSVTEAEARAIKELSKCIRGDIDIKKVSQSNITEIFPSEDGEWWWKAKISLVAIDEKAGKEKKINYYFLVAADDLSKALKTLKEGLSYVLVPYEIISMVLSPIVDVFPYFEDGGIE